MTELIEKITSMSQPDAVVLCVGALAFIVLIVLLIKALRTDGVKNY